LKSIVEQGETINNSVVNPAIKNGFGMMALLSLVCFSAVYQELKGLKQLPDKSFVFFSRSKLN
ncbi:MAG: hypothetical protein ACKPJP_21240, partial [Microcystis panniformis]